MRGNRDIRPHNHAPSCTRRVDCVQIGKTMEYRGDNIGAEERAGAYRCGAHSAGVTAPACGLDVLLLSESHETRGGPPYAPPMPGGASVGEGLKEGEAPRHHSVGDASEGVSIWEDGGTKGRPPVCCAEEGRHPLPATGACAIFGNQRTSERRGGPPMPVVQSINVGIF